MRCVICGEDFDYRMFDTCQNCTRPIRQQFTDLALAKFIKKYKDQLKLWMEEYRKEQVCRSCDDISYTTDGTVCTKGKNECPAGYPEKPNPDNIKIE